VVVNEGCKARGRWKNPKLIEMFNKVKMRKLPWILQRSSLSSSFWSYCSAEAAVTIGIDDGRCLFSHYFDASRVLLKRKVEIKAEKADKDVTKANKRVKIAKKVKKEEENME